MDVSCNPAIVAIQTQLPIEICEIIKNQYGSLAEEEAHVQYWKDEDTRYDKGEDPKVRYTKVHWISQFEWVAGMMNYYIDNVNKHNFKYDIEGISGGHFQYSVYTKGAHYDWHSDEPRNLYHITQRDSVEMVRKLSFSLQLSGEDEYEGGELLFEGSKKDEILPQPKNRGTLIVFDSRMRHKVTPVTRGVRHALVGWFVGPVWR